jgi:hypothetical protein
VPDPVWVIPKSERYDKLKEVVFGFAESLATLRAKLPNPVPAAPTGFLTLTFPWLAEELTIAAEQEAVLGQNRQLLLGLGFDGERVRNQLKEALSQDGHLAECCLSPLRLAHYLDLAIVPALAAAKQARVAQDKLDFAYQEFETSTYHQGRFKRILLSHLFNFEMEGNRTAIDDARIERLAPDTIPRILGESGVQAFLHPPGIGDCFIVEEEGASAVSDSEWMLAKRNKAALFGNLLQFYKDGVVHVGYSAPYFSPEWVNPVRKFGLFFLGTPRQTPYQNGSNKWAMTTADRNELVRWWMAMKLPSIASALGNKVGKLREATYRASEYFDASHQRTSPTERLIALAIALESLYTPADKEGLSFRVSQSVAQFIEADPAKRAGIFESLRSMYSKRSKLFHGTYDVKKYEEGTFVTEQEIAEWSGYIRRSILGFLALYFRGETSREDVLSSLDEASLDAARGDELRKRANIQDLVSELLPQRPQPQRH